MPRHGVFRTLGWLCALSSVAACGGSEEPLAVSSSDLRTANALTANALTANALTANALTANALTANALTANALTANALTANALRDPLGRELLKYVVSCALPAGDSVTISVDDQAYTFPGSLGLAPEWGQRHGRCDGRCQRWVSACVLSRVDAQGVERTISIRGDNKALRPTPAERADFPRREATYYGNLFVDGKPRFLCLSPGLDSDARVCGPSLDGCPMTVVGSCADACDREGRFGAFEDCRGGAGRPRHADVYEETVTVFLPELVDVGR
jgi:hypothetical protein